ncbi:hypothetical protein [Flavivirga spongiicola]|uniref:Uncharacterized protein n=1 Tax=Flavivirga spongiicola TaxID=421621 RepID=A0ABU7XSK2_9FLAO|nr:hypothetical protein [Flavivirga sp. MEBiC05379]MDO5978755.1 hypothetical protein [Flavivirga sp. MEBiC05379]
MKRLFIITVLIIFITGSCSKDDSQGNLVTPTLKWEANAITDSKLEISITITSSESLPEGNLEFKVDGNVLNTFSAEKGTKVFTTNYVFNDTEAHNASVVYNFVDDIIKPVSKSISIKKSIQEILQKSTRNTWVDL